MADVMPVSFPIPGESALANYDWTTVADGAGYVDFQGFDCITGAATTAYRLINETVYSYNIRSALTTTVAVEFDTSAFNSPRTIKGDAFLTFTSGIVKTAAPEVSASFNAKLQKVSGATVTDLGDITTATYSTSFGAGTTGTLFKAWNIKFPVSQTHLKKGDLLRIKITPTCTGDPTILFHDPKNRVSDSLTSDFSSQLVLSIPFKIDL